MPPDYVDKEFILAGIEFGFNIVNVSGISDVVKMPNHKSATHVDNRQLVEQAIKSEIINGRYIVAPVHPRIISPLGAIVKDNGKVRVIHDCSRPVGHCVNDFAIAVPVHYQSIDDVKEFLAQGMYMAKVDLVNAYRSVKINPTNYCATGLSWTFSGEHQETVLIDTCLPFGASASPGIFNLLTKAVTVIMKSKGFCNIVAYLDDFLIAEETYERCILGLNTLICLLRKLGFGICYYKVEGPTRLLTFLGILIDSINMTLGLPDDKLHSLHALVDEALAKKTASKRYMQTLVGKLLWASHVIAGSRSFLRNMIDVICSLQTTWQKATINDAVRADLLFWKDTLLPLAAGSLPVFDERNAISVCLFTTPTGVSAVCAGNSFHTAYADWDSSLHSLCVTLKTVIAVCLTASRWQQEWKNHRIYIHCNNSTAVSIINNSSCRHPLVMDALRKLWTVATANNFRISARYHANTSTKNRQPNSASSAQRSDDQYQKCIPSIHIAVSSILQYDEVPGIASVSADSGSLHCVPVQGQLAAVNSLPSVGDPHGPRDARPTNDIDVRAPGTLRLAGGRALNDISATSDEANHTGSPPQVALSHQHASSRGQTVLGRGTANVLFTATQVQRSRYVCQASGEQHVKQSRRNHRYPLRHAYDHAQQDAYSCRPSKGHTCSSKERQCALSCWGCASSDARLAIDWQGWASVCMA